jgi:hypothetical protein
VSTPSSNSTEQPARRRDLRDSTLGRIAIVAVVLALALVAARSCGGAGDDPLTRSEAVEKAGTVSVFEPDGVQVRYVNQGIPPRGTWLVSFHQGPVEDPTTVQTVLVDAATGEITDDGR